MTKFILLALSYLPWTIVSLLSGIAYMRLLLGPNPVPAKGILAPLRIFFNIGILRVGLVLGSVVALVFILVDVFYLKQKLGHGLQATTIRALCLIGIGIFIAVVHYILEKIIDVI